MNQLYLKVLWYIFGIIVIVRSDTNVYKFTDEYSNALINSINPAWINILNNNLKNENLSYIHIRNIKKDIISMLKLFDEIDNIFDNLLEINLEQEEGIYEINRHKRSTSQYNRSECTISTEELIEMKNEIENALQLEPSRYIETKCNFNIETTNCSALINLMKCGIHHLKNLFTDLSLNEISPNEVTKWKMKYEKLNQAYLKLEDNLYRSNNQKYKMKIDDLNNELQLLKQVIYKLEQDLNAANENIIQITIELCSSEIHSKKVHQCIEKLNNLTNINYTNVINNIIHRSFRYIISDDDMIIINYIIDFINTFDFELKYNGYQKLYEMMNIRNFMSSSYVLTFASKIHLNIQDLRIHVKNKIDEWGRNIINSNFWEINTYADKQDFSFCYYLKDIITNAYANNINNVRKILMFLDNLPIFKQKALGYYILYNEIKLKHGINGEEIIMLIYRIKEVICDLKYNELDVNMKVNLQNLKLNLPAWIKALLWDNFVTIRSTFNNYKLTSLHKYFGFIYIDTILAICPSSVNGADKWKITAEEKGAYFNVNNIDSNHDKEYKWKISAYNNGEVSYFMDKNTGNKLYTKDTIGGWKAFWYAIPTDCYQVYEYYDEDFQQWLIY